MKYRCQNCDFETEEEDDLHFIEDLSERVYVGEIFPAGQCPKCGSLIEAFDEEVCTPGNLFYMVELLRKNGYTVTENAK